MARKTRKKRRGRPPQAASLSIGDLQRMIDERRSEVEDLHERRDALQAELEEVEEEIASLNGSGAGPGRPRKRKASANGRRKGARRKVGRKKARKKARTSKKAGKRGPRGEGSLHVYLAKVLGAAKGPMKLSDIAAAAKKAGYKTTSANFGVIVGQRLAEMDGVKKVGRGMYQAK